MPENETQKPGFDWRVTSFEGARREQLRRWAELPLENILLAIEEMREVVQLLYHTLTGKRCESAGCEKTPDPIFDPKEEKASDYSSAVSGPGILLTANKFAD